MKKVVILRDLFFDQQASLGTCLVYDGKTQLFKCESLERGWVNNENRISCVSAGIKRLVLEWSPRFRKYLWEIKDEPGRSECKFHVANYWWQLNGCISLGKNRGYLDGDPVMDVSSSTVVMRKFHRALSGETEVELHIFNVLNLVA